MFSRDNFNNKLFKWLSSLSKPHWAWLNLLGNYMNNSLHLARNCPRTLSVPRCEQSVEEQIMSKDKCSEHIFAPNGGYCVYKPSNIFRNTRSFENWGISLGNIWSIIMQINPLVLFVRENHLSRCEKTPRELTALSGYSVSCSCCVHRTLLKEINQNNKKLGGTGRSLTQHNKSETRTLVYFAKNVLRWDSQRVSKSCTFYQYLDCKKIPDWNLALLVYPMC